MARNIDRSSDSSNSDEDPIGAVAGHLSKLELPNIDHAHSERAFADSKKASQEDVLLFDPAKVPEDEREKTLEMFFDTSSPSKVKRSEGIGHIRILSASYDVEGLGNLEQLQEDWEELQGSGKAIDFEAIKILAVSNRCLGGIWLLFFETGAEVDAAWEKIARATVEDKLGTHAKVTPCEDVGDGKDLHGSKHGVSVYTKDFTDKENVMEIEGALRGLGFRNRFVFKPRVYSAVGVYARNKWGLRPGIYNSCWDDKRRAGSIQDRTGPRDTYAVNYQATRK